MIRGIVNNSLMVIAIALASLSCNNPSRSSSALENETIDLSRFREFPFSRFADDYDCVLSLTQIQGSFPLVGDGMPKTIIRGDTLFLMNSESMRLAAFSLSSGEKIGAIGNFGRAGNEYLQLSGFDIDRDGKILILDSRSRQLLKFNSKTFQFEGKQLLKGIPMDIQCLQNGGLLVYQLPQKNNSTNQIWRYDSQLNHIDDVLPFPKAIDVNNLLSTRSFSGGEEDNSLIFSCDIFVDDAISVFSGEGDLLNQYVVDFGGYRIPDKDRLDIAVHNDSFDSYRCICSPAYVDSRWVIGGLFNKGNYSFFVADRDAEKMYVGEHGSSLTMCDSQKFCVLNNNEEDCVECLVVHY